MTELTWSDPVSFEFQKLPLFPIDDLPKLLSEYAVQLSESMQVPIDLPASLMLAVVASAVAKKFSICINNDWAEPCNIYVVVALPPGERKSAIFKAVTAPLINFEKQKTQDTASEIESLKQKRRIQEKELELIEKKIVTSKLSEKSELTNKAKIFRETLPDIPKTPRFLVDDVSPEKLTSIIAENEGRIALMSSEGGLFDMIAGRYSNAIPNLDVYLKSHCGDAIRVDRIGRESNFIEVPALTIGLTVQPEVIHGLIYKPGFRGRGLIGRFLYCLPKSNVGFRKITTKSVIPDTRINYSNLVLKLLEHPINLDAQGSVTSRILEFSGDAEKQFLKFRQQVEVLLRPGGKLENATDWAGKLPGAVARIAGILHLSKYPDAINLIINSDSMNSAIQIGNYFKAHALAALDLMGTDKDLEDARYVLNWIKRKKVTEFSERDLHQALKGKFKRKNETNPAIHILLEHHHIQPIAQSSNGRGRRPSPRYHVNPQVVPQNSQYPQKAWLNAVGG